MEKVAVVGSRDYPHPEIIGQHMARLIGNHFVTGGGGDADGACIEYAKQLGCSVTIHFPNWRTYGKAAGPLRNAKIVEEADRMLAFWSGNKSKGTRNVVLQMLKASKSVEVFGSSGEAVEVDRFLQESQG